MLEKRVIVTLVDSRITATYPNGKRMFVDLSQLQQVDVLTNDSGPWGLDVWWILKSTDGECRFPQDAQIQAEVLDNLFALKDFDELKFIRAMGSTSHQEFVCWARKFK